jgi:hypothetical protein
VKKSSRNRGPNHLGPLREQRHVRRQDDHGGPNGDTTAESAEVFYVNLSGAVNATIADGQGAATITNDDVSSSPPPRTS